MTAPTCYCGQPMAKRETLTHGTCWCCVGCGFWTDSNPPSTYGGCPLYFNVPSIAELGLVPLHHRQPSPN